MALWNDPARWAALCSGAACPICVRREPLDVVATLRGVLGHDAGTGADPGLRMSCVEKPMPPSCATFPEQQQRPSCATQPVSKALAAVTGAVKLIYEIHGNSLPHLHMHFFPRYPATSLNIRQSIPGW